MLRVRRRLLDTVSDACPHNASPNGTNASPDGTNPLPEHEHGPEHGKPFYSIADNLREHRQRRNGFQPVDLQFVFECGHSLLR